MSTILRPSVGVLVAIAALTGCAELRWHRGGTDAAATEQDLEACRKDARLRAHRASWPVPLADSRVMGVDAHGRTIAPYSSRLDAERFLLEFDLTILCMRGKGYERAPAMSPSPRRAKDEG